MSKRNFQSEYEFQPGDVLRLHIGAFFGVSDLQLRFKSKARLLIEADEEPIDLLKGEGGQ